MIFPVGRWSVTGIQNFSLGWCWKGNWNIFCIATSYELDIDLPGFKKDEISDVLEDGYLTISAAKGLDKDKKDKKGNYIRQERYAGAMSRSFFVGDAVTQDEVKVKYENGILKLSIPKKAEKEAVENKNKIAIEGWCSTSFMESI